MELPNESGIVDIVRRYAALVARLAPELGMRQLVLPTGTFFPDVFKGDQASLERLVARMQEHAGMQDVPIRVGLNEPEAEASTRTGGGCGSGSCATELEAEKPRLAEESDGSWRIHVPKGETLHPVALTTNFARVLALIFLEETRDETRPIEAPVGVTTDLAAVALGFGVLTLQGSYIYAKSCGGPSVAQLTALTPSELAIPVALFAAAGGHSLRGAKRHLEVTPAEALVEAERLVAANAHLVSALVRRPESLATGAFSLKQERGIFGSLFGSKRQGLGRAPDDISEASLEALEADLARTVSVPKTPSPRAPRSAADEELRRLVDEALEATAPSAGR